MRILPADQGIPEALNIIQHGGIVAHATETCYGFACDLTNPEAIQTLFLLKDRPDMQQVSALFPSVSAAKEWVEWNERAEELAEKYLPGPLTMILPLKTDQRSMINDQHTLGVRISSHPIAQNLAEIAHVPLSTTSANLHGMPSAYSAEDIVDQFREREIQPDLILDSGVLPALSPSTVIAIEGGMMRIVRQGLILVAEISEENSFKTHCSW